eukprot:9231189-Prorocentrum_lima.AAC.1
MTSSLVGSEMCIRDSGEVREADDECTAGDPNAVALLFADPSIVRRSYFDSVRTLPTTIVP